MGGTDRAGAGMSAAVQFHYDDFTEAHYRTLLTAAAARYRFAAFPDFDQPAPVCLWRHDIDFSPQRARRLATLEADAGVRATYFVNLHSDFYNALEGETVQAIREIVGMGHQLGLHFDAAFHGRRPADAGERDALLAAAREILEQTFGAPVGCYSLHNPGVAVEWQSDQTTHAGMVNAYCLAIRTRYTYVSDSNGVWRHRRLADVVADAPAALHVLTHPGWWTPVAMSPRDRIARCIDGRARATNDGYDRLLEEYARPNVGRGPQ